jgi:hypothetical protein
MSDPQPPAPDQTLRDPQTLFAFFKDHPDLHDKGFWFHDKHRETLYILRSDTAIWLATCALARQAWLSRKELESYLDACAASDARRGRYVPARQPAPTLAAAAPPWDTEEFQCTKDGRLKETFGNWLLLLRQDPQYGAALQFDEFQHQLLFEGVPLPEKELRYRGGELSLRYQIPMARPRLFLEAVGAFASRHACDTLRDWLQRLRWDGTRRLNDWLCQYGNAPASPLNVYISRMLPVEMAARGLMPGCQARYVPIFIGPEHCGKTTAVLTLGAPWAATFDLSLDTKEAQLAVRGLWLAELGELDTLYRSRESRLRGFLSTREDHVVNKYESFPSRYPRRTCFVGTTSDTEFLPAGNANTRFFPVSTPQWDIPGLTTARDQILAEAVAYLQAHPDWWMIPDELQPALAESRSQHENYQAAPTEKLRLWLQRTTLREFTMREALEDGLEIADASRWTKAKEMEVGNCLRHLGCTPHQARRQGKKIRLWTVD